MVNGEVFLKKSFQLALIFNLLDILSSVVGNWIGLSETSPFMSNPLTREFVLSLGLIWKTYALSIGYLESRLVRWLIPNKFLEAIPWLILAYDAFEASFNNITLILHFEVMPFLNTWTL